MTIERDVLEALIKHDEFYNEDTIVSGLAQKAVDTDFDQLSDKQKAVLQPFLQKECVGVEDPGGYHNNCQNILEEKELLNAIENSGFYGAILCENCRDEHDGYAHEWERIKAE